jgi:hypothetical protein
MGRAYARPYPVHKSMNRCGAPLTPGWAEHLHSRLQNEALVCPATVGRERYSGKAVFRQSHWAAPKCFIQQGENMSGFLNRWGAPACHPWSDSHK